MSYYKKKLERLRESNVLVTQILDSIKDVERTRYLDLNSNDPNEKEIMKFEEIQRLIEKYVG